MSTDTANIGEVISGFLRGVPRARQPLLIALAERLAAERYRAWAVAADDSRRSELLACAEREIFATRRMGSLPFAEMLTGREPNREAFVQIHFSTLRHSRRRGRG